MSNPTAYALPVCNPDDAEKLIKQIRELPSDMFERVFAAVKTVNGKRPVVYTEDELRECGVNALVEITIGSTCCSREENALRFEVAKYLVENAGEIDTRR